VAGRRAPGARRTSVAERRERRAAVEDPAIVLDAAAAFLAVRPRSIGETRRRLQSLGYRAVLIDHVIDRLLAYGYLDDAAFGRAWLESRDRARPRGSHALRSELLAKGLERDLIASLLAERDDSSAPRDGDEPAMAAGDPDVAAAERLLTRRRAALMREPDPRRRRERGYALLARNGFDPDVIRQVLAAGLAEQAADEPGASEEPEA
jgi:regulatory protein